MSIINSSIFENGVDLGYIALVVGCALLMGVLMSFMVSFRLRTSKGVLITGALMPAIVALVFALVELFFKDNETTTIARLVTVAVAFGLIRFRSSQGKAEEMLFLFMVTTIGFAFGLGYIFYGLFIGLGLTVAYIIITYLPIFTHKKFTQEKLLKVTIPESLDYSDIFVDTFKNYLKESELVGVKTTAMGSMYKLTYRVVLKNANQEKVLIDEIRTKNGNLEISLLPYVNSNEEL